MAAQAEVTTLKPRDEAVLSEYLGRVGSLMGLGDWEFDVRWEQPPEDGAVASCAPIYVRRVAIFRFAPEVRRMDPAEVRLAVVHELIHPHLAEACEAVRSLDGALGSLVFPMVWSSYERGLERGVDALAALLAPSMPLVEWP